MTFLELVAVVNMLVVLTSPVMFDHEGTLNYSVTSNIFGSRRTASGEEPKPEMSTRTVSGMAMFPPIAVKW